MHAVDDSLDCRFDRKPRLPHLTCKLFRPQAGPKAGKPNWLLSGSAGHPYFHESLNVLPCSLSLGADDDASAPLVVNVRVCDRGCFL